MELSNIQQLNEAEEKGRLIRESILIIKKLADNDFADMDGFVEPDSEMFKYTEEFQQLILSARYIVNDRWFKHLLNN